MILTDRNLTARDAAETYARALFEEPRKIGQWNGNRFRLVGGVKWYEVREHWEGWEVVVVEKETGETQ